MKNLKVFGILPLLFAMMVGCSGQMEGVVRRDANRIAIAYSDSRLASAELMTVLADGEQFRGKSARLDRTQEVMKAASTPSYDNTGNFEAVQGFPGNSKATLSGNRGNVIQCRFKIADTIIGFSSGGTGICQVSDGRVIDVFF